MRKRIVKLALVVSMSAVVFESGCGSLSNLPSNIWKGFGYGLGAIPANIAAGFICSGLASMGITC